MLETSARLLRLLTLLQTRSYWPGAELAERLEVTERTVRRDIDRLRSLGYPVDSSAGVAGGYRLGAGASLPPLLLEDDEALAVSLGLRTAASGTVAGIEEAAVRALAKLEQVLPARLRSRVKALHAAVAPLYYGPSVPADVLAALAGACRGEEQVRFRYEDGKGRTTDRTVEPHGLVHTGARWYLLAWDLGRADWRTFRVDRITADGVARGRRFTRREVPGGDVAAYVSRAISIDPYALRAQIVLHAPLAELAPRIPPTVGRLSSLDDDTCLFETGATSPSALALHIALLDVDFQVLEPPELLDAIARIEARLARARRAPAPRT
ncbi:MAG: helix-turn-helix transcriptional regulator [Myxococcota bacterium]